jgi:CheY-like chemotaxis protein
LGERLEYCTGVSFSASIGKGFHRTQEGHAKDMSGHETDMNTYPVFEQELQDALAHLYDPAYRPSAFLRSVLNCDTQQGLHGIRRVIIQAIEDLKPEDSVPDNARVKRIYCALNFKYVQNLSQEETSERLGITARHLRREQPEAIHALALYLWERYTNIHHDTQLHEDGEEPLGWRSQVKEEIASLQESAPNTNTNVLEVVESAIHLESAITAQHHVRIESAVQPGLVAAIHPVVLQQVLITAISQLARSISEGQIIIRTDQVGATVRLFISGQPLADWQPAEETQASESQAPDWADRRPLDASFISAILNGQTGSVSLNVSDERAEFLVELRAAAQTILVVDDNVDLGHLYRRYAMGTRFNVVHCMQGQRVMEMVEVYKPAVIVLDVMLPDIDGWLLLSQLREHPQTRDIPIIVCSVVREEELARSLGARAYLQKPIQRLAFIQALDQVLHPAGAG